MRRATLEIMSTVAIYSLKGGVGKTTLSVNLAWCAAVRSARRTLLWDLDPQAASTWLLGDDTTDGPAPDSAQAMFSKDIAVRRNARPTAYPNLDLIGADASLRSLDRFFHDLDKKKRLARLLEGLTDYDRIILDCPPGLTETADQVMRGADLIVIPVIPSPLSTRAYEAVIRHLGGKTAVLPVHMMVDRRRKLHADALALHPDWPVIPMASMIEMMASKRAPVGAFAPQSAAAQAFADLWRAIERKLAERQPTT